MVKPNGSEQNAGLEPNNFTSLNHSIRQQSTAPESPNQAPPPTAKPLSSFFSKLTLGRERRSWSPFVEAPDHYGFFKLKNINLKTLDERDYEALISNDEKWLELKKTIDSDNKYSLDMFPFSEKGETSISQTENLIERLSQKIGNHLKAFAKKSMNVSVELPQRFYSISRNEIEDRFPGGRLKGDPGDGDIRDMISALKNTFRENLAHHIFTKRAYQILFVSGFLFFIFALLQFRSLIDNILIEYAKLGPIAGTMTYSVILLILISLTYGGIYKWFELISTVTYDNYKNAQTESCKTLHSEAGLRSKTLSNAITTLAAKMKADESIPDEYLKNESWAELSYRRTMIIYWLGRRLENFEKFAQIQMWLVRRTHYLYRIAAKITNSATDAFLKFLMITLFVLLWTLSNPHDNGDILYHTFILAPWQWLSHQVIEMVRFLGFDLIQKPAQTMNFLPTQMIKEALTFLSSYQQASDKQDFMLKALTISGMSLLKLIPIVFALILSIKLVRQISKHSSEKWNTSVDLIREHIVVSNWDRHHKLDLPHLIANQVKTDKTEIQKRVTLLAGSRR